jgi:hypothetical protein
MPSRTLWAAVESVRKRYTPIIARSCYDDSSLGKVTAPFAVGRHGPIIGTHEPSRDGPVIDGTCDTGVIKCQNQAYLFPRGSVVYLCSPSFTLRYDG